MKQIIPFQKELIFKTKVCEVTSISLEHSIKKQTNDSIIGVFLVSGDYKMTEGSINREKFSFDIPFEISLEKKYIDNSVKMDIDNFYYEIINSEILKVNIDVYVIGDEIINNEKNEVTSDDVDNFSSMDVVDGVRSEEDNDEDFSNSSIKYKDTLKVDELNDLPSDINLFNSIDFGDTYVTYFVYVVKENDTLEDILKKFNVKREELEEYNDLSNIHEKAKLIIPNHNE